MSHHPAMSLLVSGARRAAYGDNADDCDVTTAMHPNTVPSGCRKKVMIDLEHAAQSAAQEVGREARVEIGARVKWLGQGVEQRVVVTFWRRSFLR